MPEFLINYRNTITGALRSVHIVNIDDPEQAMSIADNSLLLDEYDNAEYNYDSMYQLIHRSPDSSGIPF